MNNYPIAKLADKTLDEVRDLERKLREKTGEDIVLIAYCDRKV